MKTHADLDNGNEWFAISNDGNKSIKIDFPDQPFSIKDSINQLHQWHKNIFS